MRINRSLRTAMGAFLLITALAVTLPAQTLPPAVAAGTVGDTVGGPFDVLTVNGSAGGPTRTVRVGVGRPLTFDVAQPPTTATPANFTIWGFIGTPGPGDIVPLPAPLNGVIFPPALLNPADPFLFTLADNIGIGGTIPFLPSTPTPWSLTLPMGLNFEVEFALQGVIIDPSSPVGFSITNAVYVEIVSDLIEPLYTKIAGHPSAQVPGARDLGGNPVSTEWRAFEDLVGTPYGAWMVKGRTQLGSDLETCLMLGAGSTGTLFGQEGQPIPGGIAGEVYDFFGSGVGRFNDVGDFAFSARARGGSSTTAQKVISVINLNATIATQQGDAYLGLMDNPVGSSGDEVVGNSIGSIHLLNDGTIGAQDSTIGNIHSSRRPALFYDNVAFHQTGVTQVTGLNAGPAESWATIDANFFYTTPDNSRWMARGRIVASSTMDQVLVVDGNVVLQEGLAIPGTADVISSVLAYNLQPNGDWIARGALNGGGVYAVMNGTVVAKTNDPLFTGAGESWGTGFSAVAANRVGDWVIAGQSDLGLSSNDDVLVSSTGKVLVREGDPVDLDDNGFFDDNVFIGRGNDTLTSWSADNLFVTDDGWVYFFASLNDGAGNDLNSNPSFSTPLALLRVRLTQ